MKWITEVIEENERKKQKEFLNKLNLNEIRMEDTMPRRSKIYMFNSAEKAIYDAMQEVEKMPADVRLTDAVILLQKAKDKVSDFIDGIE